MEMAVWRTQLSPNPWTPQESRPTQSPQNLALSLSQGEASSWGTLRGLGGP